MHSLMIWGKKKKSEIVKQVLTIITQNSSMVATVKLVGYWEFKLLNEKLMKSVSDKQLCISCMYTNTPSSAKVHRWALNKKFPLRKDIGYPSLKTSAQCSLTVKHQMKSQEASGYNYRTRTFMQMPDSLGNLSGILSAILVIPNQKVTMDLEKP